MSREIDSFGDLGDGHPGVEQLLNAAHPLDVGDRLALIVFHDLLGNPLNRLGLLVVVSNVPHVDRDGGQPALARGQGAPLTGAYPHHAVGAAHRDDRVHHAVLFDAGHEIGVEGGVVANIGFQRQHMGIEVFQCALVRLLGLLGGAGVLGLVGVVLLGLKVRGECRAPDQHRSGCLVYVANGSVSYTWRILGRSAIEGRWATTMRFFAGPTLLVIDENWATYRFRPRPLRRCFRLSRNAI